MVKIILGLVGEIGAGKDTVADYLRHQYSAPMHKFSSPMTDCLERLGIPKTRENISAFSVITRKQYGESVYADVIARDCDSDPSPIVIANGVRRLPDVKGLEKLPGFRLVYVTAPDKIRFDRIRNRGEKAEEQGMTWETFMANETLPTEVAIREIGANADYTIDNSGDFDSLYRQVEHVLKTVQEKG